MLQLNSQILSPHIILHAEVEIHYSKYSIIIKEVVIATKRDVKVIRQHLLPRQFNQKNSSVALYCQLLALERATEPAAEAAGIMRPRVATKIVCAAISRIVSSGMNVTAAAALASEAMAPN